ncbi:MAG: 30S ribosomal protein S18 [Planctomycetes bacterium]|jgi:small subunit ribosomal protein S18|nr:30S ribosomal protein S18 [Planctomycetota bacterium]
MAKRFGARSGPAKRKRKPRFREQAKCRFCRDKGESIDYKDTPVLSKLVTQHGKLFSRKRSGNCASCQRKVKDAVKYARFMALMPYVS